MNIWRYWLMCWLGAMLRRTGQRLLDAAEFDMPPAEFDRLMEAGTPVKFPPGRPRPVVRHGPLGGFYRCDHMMISGVTRPPICFHGCAMEWTDGNLTWKATA
jgi:hypothetical protein